MTQIMTAAEMTDGQIENAVNKLRDAMRKHRSEITSDVAQQVLGVENLGMMMFAPFRECAEAVSNLIVRKVKVNRSRSRQGAIEATGRAQYTDRMVVDAMPKGEGDEVEVVFFKPDLSNRNGHISDDDLEKEFELRGLKPADPISVAAVNEADPAFADEKPHGTHWKDAKGNWCYAAFNPGRDVRKVIVKRSDSDWNDNWWFAGVRNSLHFSSHFREEFCFVSCPFQPPNIRPTSSTFAERAAYFLVSKDLVSQRIRRSILIVSIFRTFEAWKRVETSRENRGFDILTLPK